MSPQQCISWLGGADGSGVGTVVRSLVQCSSGETGQCTRRSSARLQSTVDMNISSRGPRCASAARLPGCRLPAPLVKASGASSAAAAPPRMAALQMVEMAGQGWSSDKKKRRDRRQRHVRQLPAQRLALMPGSYQHLPNAQQCLGGAHLPAAPGCRPLGPASAAPLLAWHQTAPPARASRERIGSMATVWDSQLLHGTLSYRS